MSLTMDIAKETENFDYDKYFRAFAYFFSQYLPSREDVKPEARTVPILTAASGSTSRCSTLTSSTGRIRP